MPAREIINLQVGQCGNQVGNVFWEMLLAEHGLDLTGTSSGRNDIGLHRAGVYFTQFDGNRHVPRSIQVDLEPGVIDSVRSEKLGKLFGPDTFVHGQAGAGNNWAKGFYTEGAELIDGVLDVARKHADGCDSLQGFQLIHSLGGGTGSGMGSLLLSKLREEYPDRMLATFSVMPSSTTSSDTVVEPYNTVLSYHQLVETSDMTVCLDNNALYAIASNALKIKTPSFRDVNQTIAKVMCGVSTSLRFPGQLNGDLRKMAMNLVPFPRLHFLVPSYAPLVDPKAQSYQSMTVKDLTSSLFDRRNMLVDCDPQFGRYLTAYAIFRGNIPSREVEVSVHDLQSRKTTNFVDWIPDNVSFSIVNVPPVGQKRAATALANTTSTQEMFKRSLDMFSAMYKRRAFTHWYEAEGMDMMEFTEAESNTKDLIAEYQQYQEAEIDQEEYEEEGASGEGAQ